MADRALLAGYHRYIHVFGITPCATISTSHIPHCRCYHWLHKQRHDHTKPWFDGGRMSRLDKPLNSPSLVAVGRDVSADMAQRAHDVTGLCAGNSPVTGEFPAQMASNVENGSIWWRHHGPTDGNFYHLSKHQALRQGSARRPWLGLFTKPPTHSVILSETLEECK